MTRGSIRRRGSSRGFSLVEVLVALIVLSIGLLGIAKIQAIAFSATGVSSYRSIAAIEAASLASMMRANRAYWSVGSVANAQINVNGSTVTSADATFNGSLATATAGSNACMVGGALAPCTAINLAAFDLNQWAQNLQAALPGDSAQVFCPNAVAPINCTISVTWNEKVVAMNVQGQNATNNAAAGSGAQTYTLYVQP